MSVGEIIVQQLDDGRVKVACSESLWSMTVVILMCWFIWMSVEKLQQMKHLTNNTLYCSFLVEWFFSVVKTPWEDNTIQQLSAYYTCPKYIHINSSSVYSLVDLVSYWQFRIFTTIVYNTQLLCTISGSVYTQTKFHNNQHTTWTKYYICSDRLPETLLIIVASVAY